MGALVGKDCVAYRNTGTTGSPTWSAINQAKDAKLPFDAKAADSSSRGTSGFATKQPTLIEVAVSLSLLHDPADTNFAALLAAFFARTKLDLAFSDGPIATTGSVYARMINGYLTKWDKGEPLDGLQTVDSEYAPGFPISGQSQAPVLIVTV
jgi:hypothetical protein